MVGVEDIYTAALKILMEDTFDAYAEVEYKDPETKRQMTKTEKIIDNQICLLAFKTVSSEDKETGYVKYGREDVLTTLPNIKLPMGSTIVVRKAIGKTYKYQLSQQPSMHTTHTKYVLKKVDIG
ncbi:hypothetical protein [Peptoniphilus sp.]|uniref:hypothetical protein n=1 Tax=Peptoniphilus sp. TaxID=1971214 RepID=UPI003995BE1C